jgi:hypothetical protein
MSAPELLLLLLRQVEVGSSSGGKAGRQRLQVEGMFVFRSLLTTTAITTYSDRNSKLLEFHQRRE